MIFDFVMKAGRVYYKEVSAGILREDEDGCVMCNVAVLQDGFFCIMIRE